MSVQEPPPDDAAPDLENGQVHDRFVVYDPGEPGAWIASTVSVPLPDARTEESVQTAGAGSDGWLNASLPDAFEEGRHVQSPDGEVLEIVTIDGAEVVLEQTDTGETRHYLKPSLVDAIADGEWTLA